MGIGVGVGGRKGNLGLDFGYLCLCPPLLSAGYVVGSKVSFLVLLLGAAFDFGKKVN
jgi:hypothetical protein